MARALIGRTVRRLRGERDLSQQALATRLGISASYLNLIEHDQRAVTASLLIKLAETLRVDLAALVGHRGAAVGGRAARGVCRSAAWRRSGARGRSRGHGRRRPTAARAVLALYRACGWRGRMPRRSPCPRAGASCCRTRKRATCSMSGATIFRRWRTVAEPIGGELGRRRRS